MNLAEQLKKELLERARNSETCKKHLLNYVMDCFRDGDYPVTLYINDYAYLVGNKEWLRAVGASGKGSETIEFKYENGRHYGKVLGKTWHDITDTRMASMYVVDGRDESDKKLFLESEGFHVRKEIIRGVGKVLLVTY